MDLLTVSQGYPALTEKLIMVVNIDVATGMQYTQMLGKW